ncbi:MAG: tetratricopeptide repeat protein [Planctomycetes bacterium]|nr:tetratricopeptide repeat protein [Planctomycetota bacterium]
MPDWFRRTSWTEGDKAEFEAKLGRARRSSRGQYVRIQGVHLAEAGLHREAAELFERVLAEFPEPLEIAPALSGLGQSLLALGQREPALDAMRRCVLREREYPNVKTDAWLEFAFIVASLDVRDLFEEARGVLLEHDAQESQMIFPLQRFKLHASRAILAGTSDVAAMEAAAALREAARSDSGLRYHGKLGLVGDEFAGIKIRLRGIVGG